MQMCTKTAALQVELDIRRFPNPRVVHDVYRQNLIAPLKHANYKGQALLLSHLIGQAGTYISGGSTYKNSPPPPNETQFFQFCIHFHRKVPTSKVHTPSQWVHAPP